MAKGRKPKTGLKTRMWRINSRGEKAPTPAGRAELAKIDARAKRDAEARARLADVLALNAPSSGLRTVSPVPAGEAANGERLSFSPPHLDPAPPPDPAIALLATREKTHGDYREVAAIAQGVKDLFRKASGYVRLNAEQREALDMKVAKMARILCGDPNHADHWLDDIGYARLAMTAIGRLD